MLQKIYESAEKLLLPQSINETYLSAVREAVKITQADYGSIFLEQNGLLQRVYTNVPFAKRIEPRKEGYTYKAFKTNKTFIMSTTTLKEVHPILIKNGIRSLVIIPLAHHKKTIGILTLQAKKNKHFTKERLEALKIFGSLVSLAIQNNKLYNETRNALKTRDLFISMAAHELRTPTTTIQGYVQMMKKKLENGSPMPTKWVDILYAETVRLNNLLKELLRIEQIRTGQFSYEWKNNSMKEIIERALAYAKVNLKNHKVLFMDTLGKNQDLIYSDFDKILQVIITLLNNAAKFSPIGSEIKIELGFDDPHFIVKVIDPGEGISEKDLPHIFGGFYKGSKNTKEGLGLGLFLAENIVQRHRGVIKAKSKIGKGTTLEIRLPTV